MNNLVLEAHSKLVNLKEDYKVVEILSDLYLAGLQEGWRRCNEWYSDNEEAHPREKKTHYGEYE